MRPLLDHAIVKALTGVLLFVVAIRIGGPRAFAAPGPASHPGVVDLQWQFEKGKIVYLKIATETRQTMKVMNNDVDQSQKLTLFLSWTPTDKKDDTWRLRQMVEGVIADIDIGGSPCRYDSTKKKNPNDPLGKVFAALVGSEITLILDINKGEIAHIEGREDLLEKLRVAAPKAPPLPDRVCDTILAEVVKQFSIVLTGKRVEQGEKWVRKRTLDEGPLGKFEQKYVCRYDGKEAKDRRLDRVGIEVVQKYETSANPPEGIGGLPFKITKSDLKSIEPTDGFALYNSRKGRIEAQSQRLELEGSLEIEIGGQPSKFELWQGQEITIETSEESLLKHGTGSTTKTEPLQRKPRSLRSADPQDVGWPLPRELYVPPPSPKDTLRVAAFSPDGRILATGGEDIRLLDSPTRKLIRRFGFRNPSGFRILTFSPDSRFLFSDGGFTDKRDEYGQFYDICLWEVPSGKLIRKFQGHHNAIDCLAIAPDGKTLVASSGEGSIRAWDVATGRELSRPYCRPIGRGPNGVAACRFIVFSPSGKFLATKVAGEPVRLWDIARAKEARQLHHKEEPKGPPRLDTITFAPDGRTLAAAIWAGEKPICFWDVESGRFLGEWVTVKASTSKSNFLGINGLDYTPDGKLLASTCDDETLRLWEVATGVELVRWRVQGGTSLVGFSPDGRTLVAWARDGSLIFLEWGHRYVADSSKSQLADAAALWAALAETDARAAFRAVQELIARPDSAVAFLGEHLQGVPVVPPTRLAQLLAELDHKEFSVRERASQKLRELAEAAEPVLREALGNSSLEVRRRVRRVLEQLDAPPSRERLRFLRAVMVLEYIGTPEARRVLERLAEGMRGIRRRRVDRHMQEG
jgi:WD40 repeat protein